MNVIIFVSTDDQIIWSFWEENIRVKPTVKSHSRTSLNMTLIPSRISPPNLVPLINSIVLPFKSTRDKDKSTFPMVLVHASWRLSLALTASHLSIIEELPDYRINPVRFRDSESMKEESIITELTVSSQNPICCRKHLSWAQRTKIDLTHPTSGRTWREINIR